MEWQHSIRVVHHIVHTGYCTVHSTLDLSCLSTCFPTENVKASIKRRLEHVSTTCGIRNIIDIEISLESS